MTQSQRVDDMITALIQMYNEGGWLPKWPNPSYTNIMIGTHADAVIADAYVNGFRNYDVEKLMKLSARMLFKHHVMTIVGETDIIGTVHTRLVEV